jgi:hypothetical protein
VARPWPKETTAEGGTRGLRREPVAGRDATEAVDILDRSLLVGLSPAAAAESVIASAKAWSLVRDGDIVTVRSDYAEEDEVESETIPVDELVVGLSMYRDAVFQGLQDGHQLDERWWAQRNPG